LYLENILLAFCEKQADENKSIATGYASGQDKKGIHTSILLGAFCDYGRLAIGRK